MSQWLSIAKYGSLRSNSINLGSTMYIVWLLAPKAPLDKDMLFNSRKAFGSLSIKNMWNQWIDLYRLIMVM